MKIKKIEYENFRNFKERGIVECSTDGKVTIIYGINGAGKTTFHQLFQWIIYGETHFNKTASDKMYNFDYESKLSIGQKFKVFGEICFEDSGVDYLMRREWIYEKKGLSNGSSYKMSSSFYIDKKIDSADWVRVDNPTEFIEQILPSGLADYFFFDGESMITDLKAKGRDSATSLKEALYLMLDLSIYDKAAEYIGNTELKTTVLGSLFLSKTGMGSSSELITLGQQMESAQNKRDSLEKTDSDYENKIKELRARAIEISEKIGNSKTQAEYEKQRQETISRRDEYLKWAEREYVGFGEELIAVFPKLMISKVLDRASKTIKEEATKSKSKLINGVTKPLIDALLQEDTCICGNPLTESEKERLRGFYELLPPKGYDDLYLNFNSMANRWGKEYNREKIESFIKQAIEDLSKARKADEEIKKIDDKMKEDKENEQLVIERKKIEAALQQYDIDKRRCGDELLKAKMLVRKLEKNITELSSSVAANNVIDRKISIMKSVKLYFENFLNEKSKDYSERLERNIQELLDTMLVAKRKVSVSQDFSLRVVDNFEDESKSEGQFATVSFAYIGGIFKLLREEDILKNKEYPLVLDAPFSKLGDEPRQKVIDTIPDYAPQIIILSKDNLQDCFGEDRIGRVYTIVSNEEQNIAKIEEGFLWK